MTILLDLPMENQQLKLRRFGRFLENLGPKINTKENVHYPFLLENGYLFFTSDGHLGMGVYNLFVSKFSSTGWTKVQNLRAPINSPADDLL